MPIMSVLPGLNRQTSITVIAAGRLGSSIAGAMLKAGYSVAAVSNRRADRREWLSVNLARHHSGPVITEKAQTAADLATVVFITGPDSAIEEICAGIKWRDDQAVLHCAGVLPVSALDSALAHGASTGGFHPLQTFPSPESSDRLKDVSFAIEADNSDLLHWLKVLATNLGGSPVEIESGQRAAYHASAVMACGLVAGLVGLAAEMWEPLGVDRADALKRLIPLIRSTVDSLDEQGLPLAITGPFVRGDVDTVESHLETTNRISPEMGRAYAALALASLHIAREQGGLSDENFERIKSLLSPAIQR
ncbi:MAG: DUF2520 domain-containing protein [Chloroflexi bacterium]|nr:DUF2520 domain-containing protein [Chloroflexota bacterium]